MRELPQALVSGSFTRSQARAQGVTDRMLQGQRFVRVLPGVWASRDLTLTWEHRVAAARLALPRSAHPTGLTRIQMLGLDEGPRLPLHFVLQGDLHLALPGVFLHRTKKLAPLDEHGVGVAGAFISFCARARVVDAIRVGDWLLAAGHLTRGQLIELALAEPWRDGAHEAIWLCEHLDPRSRSLPESELRAVLGFAGLPAPEVNPTLVLDGVTVSPDLLYREHRLIVEYQGAQHQVDRSIYVADLDRLELLRAHGFGCLEVPKERLAHARTLVGRVHKELNARGYAGRPPYLDDRWQRLFARLSHQVGPRRGRARAA